MSSSEETIPLSVPNLGGNEFEYVGECLTSGWISTAGRFVTEFEQAVSSYVGSKYAISTMNGTAALHASLVVAGVKPGDLVITPNLTFVATANAVRYASADPVLVDAEDDTWQMDLDLLEEFLEGSTIRKKDGPVHRPSGRRIAAVVPVHVQGTMVDMDRLSGIGERYNLFVIEDAAEALGATFKGRSAGSFGKLGCLSFNGNKIVSSGGGGMIVTDDGMLAARLRHLTTTAKVDPLTYFHDEVGFNYRLVNVLAAIGLAQMEQLEGFVKRKREVARHYMQSLSGTGDIAFQKILPGVEPNWWLFTIRTKRQPDLLDYLNRNRIVSRPFWMPMSSLPMYRECIYLQNADRSASIHRESLAIPCSTNITDSQLETVAQAIKTFYRFDAELPNC